MVQFVTVHVSALQENGSFPQKWPALTFQLQKRTRSFGQVKWQVKVDLSGTCTSMVEFLTEIKLILSANTPTQFVTFVKLCSARGFDWQGKFLQACTVMTSWGSPSLVVKRYYLENRKFGKTCRHTAGYGYHCTGAPSLDTCSYTLERGAA